MKKANKKIQIKNRNNQKGVTMVALVITIIVLLLITGIAIRVVFGEDGLIDRTLQSRFITDFKQVEESVRLYVAERQIDIIGNEKNKQEIEKKIASIENFKIASTQNTKISKTEDILPVTTKLTSSEKETIKNDMLTLAETIKKVTEGKTIDERTFYWIDLEKLNLKMKHRYIIDAESMQIYDHDGEEFSKSMWHIPEIGANVENINDFEEPQEDMKENLTVSINVNPESNLTTSAVDKVEVSIDYDEKATGKYYAIGEDGERQEYTGTFEITTNCTIYAYATSSTGNGQATKIIDNIKEVIEEPIIESNYGYPIITEYGVTADGETTIIYDTKTGIKNYYSLDSGITWQEYTGPFNMTGDGTIIAKSIKTETGLEAIASKTINQPSDALPSVCYDGSDGTYNGLESDNNTFSYWTGTKYIKVDEDMIGKEIKITYTKHDYADFILIFYDENNSELSRTTLNNATWTKSSQDIILPQATDKIGIYMTHWAQSGKIASNCIYEIRTIDEPLIIAYKCYPALTEYGVEQGYYNITINYFTTSVENLYKIDDQEWKAYDGPIRLEFGQTIYAKGIDKYGKETSVIPSYTSSLPSDALPDVCYDGSDGTYNGLGSNNNTFDYWTGTKYIKVDEGMIGKEMRIIYTKHAYANFILIFYDENNSEISRTTLNNATWTKSSQDITLPQTTDKIGIYMTHWSQSGKIASNCIYEIKVVE